MTISLKKSPNGGEPVIITAEMTNNPLDLGISGLVQFIPLLALTLVVGQVADRYDRRALIRLTQATKALAAIALAVGTAGGWLTREWMFVILFVIGGARAFEMPLMHAIVPDIVPQSRVLLLSVWSRCGLCALRRHIRDGCRAGEPGAGDVSQARQKAGHDGIAARGIYLYPRPAGAARRDLA
jgi:hypothetical protein